MTKKTLFPSILLSSLLLNTGCMKKDQPIISNSSSPIVAETHINTKTPVDSPPHQDEGKIRQMKTVQGDIITVREHSRGFSFPQYQGKIVLVQIFGKDCPYCFEEMPTVNKIQYTYRDKLSVIGIQGQPPMTKEEAVNLIREHDMNYPIIDQDEARSILVFLRDVYDWRGILPYILLIKNGQIEQVFQGADKSFEEISQGINDIP